MIRRLWIAAAALSIFAVSQARAQALDGVAALMATGEEQIGQSVGQAVLGGESVFVTAKGVAKLRGPLPRTYNLSVEGAGQTAVEAAKDRDAKLDRLRAVAKRFGVEMTLGEPSYARPALGPALARTATPPVLSIPPIAAAPPQTPSSQPVTATTAVRFTRPPGTAMPAFMDALHDAGIDNLADTNTPASALASAAQLFGLTGPDAAQVDQALWDKASADAVMAARRRAQVLAEAAGRHIGAARQILMLGASVQGDDVVVTVAARFSFAP